MCDIIKVSGMTKDYGNDRGIFGFDFSVKKGEAFGIVGTNGSGKTTTLRHLMGFLKPDKGSCSIMGMDCRRKADKIMKHIGYVPGDIDFPDVGSGTSFLKIQADFLGIKDTKYINELVDLFKIDTDAPLKRMSKGMKQKTALVCAFMAKPDIYLLDEPSTGLDPLMRDTLIELILKEKKRGATIVMSSHIFKELEDTCDRVLFIHNGKQVETADRKMFENSTVERYRIGFKGDNEYRQFISNTVFEVYHTNDRYLHTDINVPRDRIGEMFEEFSGYDLRYMKYRPYTLENYYTDVMETGGILL